MCHRESHAYNTYQMDNCNYANNLIRTMQAVAAQAGNYAATDGWRNIPQQPTPSSYSVGLIFVAILTIVILLLRPSKKHISQSI